jgi:hypothetical protein
LRSGLAIRRVTAYLSNLPIAMSDLDDRWMQISGIAARVTASGFNSRQML